MGWADQGGHQVLRGRDLVEPSGLAAVHLFRSVRTPSEPAPGLHRTDAAGRHLAGRVRRPSSIRCGIVGAGCAASSVLVLRAKNLATNVFNANSLLHRSPEETHTAVSLGYAGNVMWGADYPHVEGTLTHPGGPSSTRVAMQLCFAGVPEEWTRRMLGGTAIDIYGLDEAEVAKVAASITAPTPEDLASPPAADEVPGYWSGAD